MYCYRITNLINGKKYIGITIDYQRRWKEHISRKESLISKSIKKNGVDNFKFEIVEKNLSVEDAEQLEIELIQKENTLSPNGYNLAKGGLYGGTKNKVSEEDIIYIKNHRNIPEYLLYDEFSDKICYGYFKQIYQDRVRKDIIPSVPQYPYNVNFSCQFIKTNLTYNDIVDIRKRYGQKEYWKDIYKDYQDKVAPSTFWEIYTGRSFKLIMPEVFTEENKKNRMILAHRGENSPRAILKEKDVLEIRRLFSEEQKTRREISNLYPQISYDSICDIIRRKTWKNI